MRGGERTYLPEPAAGVVFQAVVIIVIPFGSDSTSSFEIRRRMNETCLPLGSAPVSDGAEDGAEDRDAAGVTGAEPKSTTTAVVSSVGRPRFVIAALTRAAAALVALSYAAVSKQRQASSAVRWSHTPSEHATNAPPLGGHAYHLKAGTWLTYLR